jgi:hypothetical protein
MDYRIKYLKYKQKYLQLKKLSGGSYDTAKNYFFANYNKPNIDGIIPKTFISKDSYLTEHMSNNFGDFLKYIDLEIQKNNKEIDNEEKKYNDEIIGLRTQSIDIETKKMIEKKKKETKDQTIMKIINKNTELEAIKLLSKDIIFENASGLFYYIYYLTKEKEKENKSVIDTFAKFYLNNSMGNPNSIENYGRLLDAISDLKILNSSKKLQNKKDINNFIGLSHKEDGKKDYSDYLVNYLDKIENKIIISKYKEDNGAEIKRIKAEEGIKLEVDLPHIKVYNILTEEAAKYYGNGTQWCTAANNNNMFSYYKRKGNIYIIQIIGNKKIKSQKFQLHVESSQLMDEKDNPFDCSELAKIIKEIDVDERNKFMEWHIKLIKYKYNNETHTLEYNDNCYLEEIANKYLVYNIILSNDFNKSIDTLKNLTNLQSITFGEDFNQPIDALSGLTNLQSITFGNDFDQPIKPLEKLTNLKSISFGYYFDQPIDALSGLTNLQSISFGYYFNQPIDSLSGLTNLQSITFSKNFNQSIDSLSGLTKLQHITFGYYFNQPIDSLSGLTNLQSITFGKNFNQPIDSLSGLPNLQIYNS